MKSRTSRDNIIDRDNRFDRDNSIDNVRLLAIFAIIVMHSFPFYWVPYAGSLIANIATNQIARFAVPCFFVISGYLFAQRANHQGVVAPLKKSAVRISMLFLFWCCFYVLPYNLALITNDNPLANIQYAHTDLARWIHDPESLLLTGSKMHLWFLPALLCAMLVCAPFIAFRQFAAMLIFAAGLFVIGLCAGPYNHTLFDISLPINVRNGPILSSIFFAIGAVLTRVEDKRRLALPGAILFLVGIVGQLTEVWLLMQRGPEPHVPVYPDYLLSTLALGTGPALFAISGAAARKNKPWLWGMGRYTLGIYALHIFFIDVFGTINAKLCFSLIWNLASPLIYFSLTLLLVACLARIRLLRPLIT